MKLHQLRYLCEVIDSGLSVSRASARLHTSPSGISKQLKILEDELGGQLLTRRKTRITGITRSGEAVLPLVRRILNDVEQVRRLQHEARGRTTGTLRIATTHTHACYTLADALRAYARRYPDVTLHFRNGTPAQIGNWVATGVVDLGIGTSPIAAGAPLQQQPCYELHHAVVVPAKHPLLRVKRLTLQAIARHPLISNGETSRLGRQVEETFAAQGIRCEIAIRAADTTAMKKYVALGLGVAILPAIAVDPRRDAPLRALPASHLFEPNLVSVITLKEHALADYAQAFVRIARNHGRAPAKRAARGA